MSCYCDGRPVIDSIDIELPRPPVWDRSRSQPTQRTWCFRLTIPRRAS